MQQQRKQSLDFNELGDKHKKFEGIYAGQILIPGVPVIARMDGRAFHTLTKNAKKPFDENIVWAMQETAKYILDNFHPDIVYVQSDEISAVWVNGVGMFGGNILKMVSTMSSAASVKFYDCIKPASYLGRHMPTFDCRIWQVPDESTAAENLMWREMDATRNSIFMVAQHHYTQSELHQKNAKVCLAMLEEKGIHWENYDHWLKKGAYFRKETVLRELTPAELKRIPEAFRPNGPIARTEIKMLEIPKATSIANLADVLFHGAKPVKMLPEEGNSVVNPAWHNELEELGIE